ncbi:MAG: hypothetical protein HYZ86_02755 [Candidatus Omnitrophica bacterium]|nr:hypothetical protein [Candidatus Omnitrophota bacterium]
MANAKKRILVVDDEVELVNMLTLRLEANDYEVIASYDGQDALDKARKEQPHLISHSPGSHVAQDGRL